MAKYIENKKFFAVFAAANIRPVASFEQATGQAPLYVVESFNVKGYEAWAGQNWSRILKIHNRDNPREGFMKGRWKTDREFESISSFTPGPPFYTIRDPNGVPRKLLANGCEAVCLQEVLTALEGICSFDSWAHYDVTTENNHLRSKLAQLESQMDLLQTKIATINALTR